DEDQVISDPHPILRVAHDLKPHASVQLFARLNEAQLRQWLSQRAQLTGGTVSPDAVDALVATGDSDLRLLAREVEQLITYAAGRPKFTANKCEALPRHFSLAQLQTIYQRLLEADQSIKTGQADPLLAVDVLIAEIASRRTATP